MGRLYEILGVAVMPMDGSNGIHKKIVPRYTEDDCVLFHLRISAIQFTVSRLQPEFCLRQV
jgi:hypothetical protein